MASCKECLHYKPCKDWAIDCFHGNSIFPYEAETAKELCEYYTPTADVVPKSEVEKIFDEIENCVIGIIEPSFQELKKKYAEGEQ